MRGFEIIAEEERDEVVHGDRVVRVVRSAARLAGRGADPPLAIEITEPVGGARRPPVLLIHGLAQNRVTWRISRRSFAGALAEAGHRVLNLELRGHGRSRELGAGNARRFEEYVRDGVRVVEACGEAPFLIGHSLGGAVGVGVATEAPLRGLVHLAGVYRFATDNPALRAITRASRRLAPALTNASVRVSTGWAGALIARLYSLTDIAGHGLPLAGWVPGSIERELLEERLVDGFDWTSLEVWVELSTWAAGSGHPYAEAFRRAAPPLLVLVGDADPLIRPSDARPCFEDAGTEDKAFVVLEPFEHGAHWGHVDLILGRRAPEHVWPLILAWIAERCR